MRKNQIPRWQGSYGRTKNRVALSCMVLAHGVGGQCHGLRIWPLKCFTHTHTWAGETRRTRAWNGCDGRRATGEGSCRPLSPIIQAKRWTASQMQDLGPHSLGCSGLYTLYGGALPLLAGRKEGRG